MEEEPEVTEAIHAAAHPGRTSQADAETQAEEADGRGDGSAKADDASGDETPAPTEEAVS